MRPPRLAIHGIGFEITSVLFADLRCQLHCRADTYFRWPRGKYLASPNERRPTLIS
jgi:hypothetical protein